MKTLETKIREMIIEANADPAARWDVVAFELWGNPRDGFDCNNSWKIARDVEMESALSAARARWEVFKVNYLPKARVADITDSGFDSALSLEVDCVPFLEIRPA